MAMPISKLPEGYSTSDTQKVVIEVTRKDKAMNRDELARAMVHTYDSEYLRYREPPNDVRDMLAALAELERRCDEEPVPKEVLKAISVSLKAGVLPTFLESIAAEFQKHYFFVPRNRDTKAGPQ